MSERMRSDTWADAGDAADEQYKPLTAKEAAAFRAKHPQLSVWRVVGAQAVVGAGAALLTWLFGGGQGFTLSALYGAAVAVVPGALMARGMTSRLSSLSPAVSAVSVMGWETVKIGFTLAMLVLAPKIVQPLSWPALLASLAVCLSMYWFALLWRSRKN
jgi:ATP synthase protein I